jgi:hypothetical protein
MIFVGSEKNNSQYVKLNKNSSRTPSLRCKKNCVNVLVSVVAK